MENYIFWSEEDEEGQDLKNEEPGGTPPPRITRRTPPGDLQRNIRFEDTSWDTQKNWLPPEGRWFSWWLNKMQTIQILAGGHSR